MSWYIESLMDAAEENPKSNQGHHRYHIGVSIFFAGVGQLTRTQRADAWAFMKGYDAAVPFERAQN